MKRIIIQLTLLLLGVVLILPTGCIRKPPAEVPDSEKELDHLIILEVFYTGSLRERKVGKKTWYYHDGSNPYIKIHNPTKEVKYLDGLGIATSSFLATVPIHFDKPEQDFRKEYTPIFKVMHFPGTGKEYPIQPGETKLLTNVAVDHTIDQGWDPEWEEYTQPANPYSFDLSNADFEWLSGTDVESGALGFKENPDVPNLTKSFVEIGASQPHFEVEHNRALMLIDLPKEAFEGAENLEKLERLFEYSWQSSTGDVIPNIERLVHVIPNSSIIDCVVICPNEQYAFPPVDETIDGGWIGASAFYEGSKRPKERTDLNKAIRRIHDGKKWVDTNHSMVDFDIIEASNSKDYKTPPPANQPTEE